MIIPVQNIYYLLSYAWNRLSIKGDVNVGSNEHTDLINLLVRGFINGLDRLKNRGLDRDYVSNIEEVRGIKGKVHFNKSLTNLSFYQGKSFCEFDNLDLNILSNQIIKTTINSLLKTEGVNKQQKDKLYSHFRLFGQVEQINLEKNTFQGVKINRNNRLYGFLINVCELLYLNLLLQPQDGVYKFNDFTQDEREMRYLFENFVRNFYTQEQEFYKVKRENLRWRLESSQQEDNSFIPKMQTDITLESMSRKIIIDTKYTKNTFQVNFNKESIQSNHLYQMYAYLKHTNTSNSQSLEGILLYPTVSKNVNLSYQIEEITLRIVTVNLARNWREIHDDLLNIIGAPI